MMRLYALALVLLFVPSLPAAAAEEIRGGAPALYGVTEVIVNYVRFADREASESCDIKREEIEQTIADALSDANVPNVLAAAAKPALAGTVRVALTPEISTYNDKTQTCATYIALVVEGKHATRLAPIEERRSFTVNYWRNGMMVGTLQSTHAMSVMRAAEKMTRAFAADYKVAQPFTKRGEVQQKISERERQEMLLNSLKEGAQQKLIKDNSGAALKDLLPETKVKADEQKMKLQNFDLVPTPDRDPLSSTKP
jgi:hypothetical protein